MNQTKLMSKLFSDSTPIEFKEKIAEKIEEAKKNGTSELIEGDENLQFADLGDSVIVEDQANDNEVTRISDNPKKEDDLVLEAVDMSEAPLTEEEKAQYNEGFRAGEQFEEGKQDELEKSEDLNEYSEDARTTDATPEVELEMGQEVIEGKSKPKIYSVKLKGFSDSAVAERLAYGIRKGFSSEDESKPKTYSVKLKGFSFSDNDKVGEPESTPEVELEMGQEVIEGESKPKIYSVKLKGFSDSAMAERLARGIRKGFSSEDEPEEEVKDKVDESAGEDKHIDDKELKEIADKATELIQKVEELKETRDKETAEEVKQMSEKLLERAETCAEKGHDMTEVKDKLAQSSEISTEILDEIQQDEDKDEVEVTKINDDEAEPTSMKVLLTPAGADSDELNVTPRVSPNDASAAGKVFSQVEKIESSNPFLTCEF